MMTKSLIIPAVLMTSFVSCPTPSHSSTNCLDDLVGWYVLHDKYQFRSRDQAKAYDALIPILKYDNIYYSVCLGREVQFTVDTEDSPCTLKLSGFDATITLDDTSNTPHIVIIDRERETRDMAYISGKRHALTGTDRPAWLPYAVELNASSNDDLVGTYQDFWTRLVELEIRKDGEAYSSISRFPNDSGISVRAETNLLHTLSDQLGFKLVNERTNEKLGHRLVYNKNRKRLEYEITDKSGSFLPVCMPLTPATDIDTKLKRKMEAIGIPIWQH